MRAVLSLIFFFGTITWVFAQADDYLITNYTVDEGLPSNECHEVVQDTLGYIWIATDRGLVKWDGYEFKTYGPEDGLTDISVLLLEFGPDSTLWMMTLSNKIFRYDSTTDRIEEYIHNDKIIEKAGKSAMINWSIDNKYCFYFSFHSRISPFGITENGNIIELLDNELDQDVYMYKSVEDRIHVVANVRRGIEPKLLFNSIEYKLCEFSKDNDYSRARGFKYSENKSVLAISKGNYFFHQEELKHCKWRNKNIIDISYSDDGIYACYDDKGGIGVYTTTENFEREVGNIILSGFSVTGLTGDRNGNLWATTLESGLFKLTNRPVELINQNYTSDIVKNGNRLFVVENSNELVQYSESMDEIDRITHTGKIRNIETTGKKNDIVASALESFLVSYSDDSSTPYIIKKINTDGIIKTININDEELIILQPTKISRSTPDRIKKGEAIFIREDLRAFDFTEFGEGYAVATSTGLYHAFIKNDELLLDTIHAVSRRINALLKVESNLVLGTNSGGLLYWNGQEIIDSLKISSNLVSNSIESIELLNDSLIVVSTRKGLQIVSYSGQKLEALRTYNIENGLPTNQVLKAFCDNETIYVGTPKGLVKFEYEPDKKQKLLTIIEDFKIDGVSSSDDHVSHDRNSIRIEYKAQRTP